jgi:hypothetical protein
MIMRAPVYLDSPAVIVGQAEKLQLSDEQKESLKKIEQDARERALAVLTAAQREKLGKIPDKPISLAQVCSHVGTVTHEKSEACCAAAAPD